jgi:hypothetical protein
MNAPRTVKPTLHLRKRRHSAPARGPRPMGAASIILPLDRLPESDRQTAQDAAFTGWLLTEVAEDSARLKSSNRDQSMPGFAVPLDLISFLLAACIDALVAGLAALRSALIAWAVSLHAIAPAASAVLIAGFANS